MYVNGEASCCGGEYDGKKERKTARDTGYDGYQVERGVDMVIDAKKKTKKKKNEKRRQIKTDITDKRKRMGTRSYEMRDVVYDDNFNSPTSPASTYV